MGTDSAYSILYNSKDTTLGPYAQYAVDWDWKIKGRWARSEKGGMGLAWNAIPGLDEEAFKALLDHFGLEDWANEFPIDRIISMSPRQLALARSEKEKQYNLPRKEIRSDTLGNHGPAYTYE